jgi:tetratricopeptide (TPR) repeat protein
MMGLPFLVYVNSLTGEFLYDDIYQIVENPWVRDLSRVPQMFVTNVWEFRGETSNYYRPLMYVSFVLCYKLFGLNALGFHIVNALLHTGASLLVYLVTREVLSTRHSRRDASRMAFVASVLFAAHPIHTEAVSWVSAVPEILFTSFFLLALFFHLKDRVALSAACFALSALSKETALTFPLVILAYDFLVRKEEARRNLRTLARRYALHGLVVCAYFAVRVQVLGAIASSKDRAYEELTAWHNIINVFPLLAKYLLKLALPLNLNAWHVFHPSLSVFDSGVILSMVFAIIAVFALVLLFRQNRILFFASLMVLIPLLPALYIPAVGLNVFSERYLYLPSAGFAIILSTALSRMNRRVLFTSLSTLLTVGLVAAYSAATVERNRVWQSDITLWKDTAARSPDGFYPHGELGRAYHRQGMRKEAIEHYRAATRLHPRYGTYFNDLGNAYFEEDMLDEAIKQYQFAAALSPKDPVPLRNLSVAFRKKGWDAMSREHALRAERLEKMVRQ